MNKAKLYEMASDISMQVVAENQSELLDQVKALTTKADGGKLSISEMLNAAVAASMTIAPDISAKVTVRLLLELGLISAEETD